MKKRTFSLLLALALLGAVGISSLAASVGDTGFADVPADAWYAEAVEHVVDLGLMSGTSAAAFEPDTPTSRAMLVTSLYRRAGSPAPGPASFPDVAQGAWYSGAAGWASANGIVSGYGDGNFAPGDPVTREQLATILWRAEGSPPAQGAGGDFTDQASISPYAVGAVRWARETGIMGGKSGDRFDPASPATRAETAAILSRCLAAGGQERPPKTPSGPGGKVLVAWFSRTGSTQAVAENVAERTGGDLFELVPREAYPAGYDEVLAQAQQEQSADARPALSSRVEDMDQYDAILLGFPIWHGDAPMLIRTFLEGYDLSGKTIAPFSTSGSSGIGTAMASIRALCPEARVVDGLSIPSAALDQADTLAADWVDGLGLDAEEDAAPPSLTIEAGGQTFTADLPESDTARALLERLPLTVTMGELNGNEKYYYLPEGLPTHAERPGNIQAGDLMLYGSDCLVLFYESFSSAYSYTRLGSVGDPARLAAALGIGSVEVTFYAD